MGNPMNKYHSAIDLYIYSPLLYQSPFIPNLNEKKNKNVETKEQNEKKKQKENTKIVHH